MWEVVVEPLSESFRVIVPHLPGFSESECLPKKLSTAEYAKVIFRLLDALNVESVSLIGTSYGGQIASECAILVPLRMEQFILVNSTGFRRYHTFLTAPMVWKLIEFFGKYLLLRSESIMCFLSKRSFYDPARRPSDLCRRFYKQIMEKGKREAWLNTLHNVLLEHISEQIQSVHVPILMIWGEHDPFVRKGLQKNVAAAVPDAVQCIIPNCGHSLPLEKAAELCEEVRSFLQE